MVIFTKPIDSPASNPSERSVLLLAEELRPEAVSISTDYDKKSAIESAFLSLMADQEATYVRTWVTDRGYSYEGDFDDGNGNSAYLAKKEGADGKPVYNLFIGGNDTDSSQEGPLISGIIPPKGPYDIPIQLEGQVQEDVFEAALAIYDQFFRGGDTKLIGTLMDNAGAINITGSEKGGEIAQVLATILRKKHRVGQNSDNTMQVYTFGDTNPGDSAWATEYQDLNVKRVVINDSNRAIGGGGLGTTHTLPTDANASSYGSDASYINQIMNETPQ